MEQTFKPLTHKFVAVLNKKIPVNQVNELTRKFSLWK